MDIIGGVSPLKARQPKRGGKKARKATKTAKQRGGFAKAKGKRGGGVSQHDKWARQAGPYKKQGDVRLPGIIAMLAGSYTDRIKDYLQNFQDLPDIRAAAEKVDDEDKLASVWT